MHINISTSQAIFRWRPACWLRVRGDDAFDFLQGQFTNDLRLLQTTAAMYGLWLTLKGKVLADSFVLRGLAANEFWIGSYFSSAAVVRERLESHVIADDVVIEDATADWAGVCVMGSDAASKPPGTTGVNWLSFPGRRGGEPGSECVYLAAQGEPEWVNAFSPVVLGDEEMARRRIAAGIPAVPRDAGPADLPNEAGLETDAISYTKGCYLGQEVMARLKSMGQVRRRLWRLRGGGGGWPVPPAAVFAGPRQVGELRSAVRDEGGWIGVAMVSLMHVAPHMELSFAPDGPPTLRLEAAP